MTNAKLVAICLARLAAIVSNGYNARHPPDNVLTSFAKLQTDADRARVLDGLAAAHGADDSSQQLGNTLKRLAPRWFVVRNSHVSHPPVLVQPRFAMSLLRGPMTRGEIRAARGVKEQAE